jgi:hypothetical protein
MYRPPGSRKYNVTHGSPHLVFLRLLSHPLALAAFNIIFVGALPVPFDVNLAPAFGFISLLTNNL